MQWSEIMSFIRNAITDQSDKGQFTIDMALKGRKERAFIQGSFTNEGTLLEISPELLNGVINKELKKMSLQSLDWEQPNERNPNFHKFISNTRVEPDEIAKKLYEAFVFGLKLKAGEVYF